MATYGTLDSSRAKTMTMLPPNVMSDVAAAQRPLRRRQLQFRLLLAALGVFVLATIGTSIGWGLAASHCASVKSASTYWSDTPGSGTVQTTATNDTPFAYRPAFILLGDSITQDATLTSIHGFGTRLQEAYVRSVDVVGRGLTVYNTEQFIKTALPMVQKEISTVFNAVLITVWFGTNDATLENGPNKGQHVPVDQYRKNLITIAKALHASAPQAQILMLTPNVIDDKVRTGGDRSNEQAGIYAKACREAAKGLAGVTLLDIYGYLMDKYPNATERGALLRDGIHPNSEGNRVVFELIKEKAEALLPSALLTTPQIPTWNP